MRRAFADEPLPAQKRRDDRNDLFRLRCFFAVDVEHVGDREIQSVADEVERGHAIAVVPVSNFAVLSICISISSIAMPPICGSIRCGSKCLSRSYFPRCWTTVPPHRYGDGM